MTYTSILDMPSKKFKKKSTSKTNEVNQEAKTSPRTAKIVLFVFGVGPLILMCLFLFSNGFFNSPWESSKSLDYEASLFSDLKISS